MKRIRTIALGLALCSALSACSRFVPSSYTRVSAHSQTKSEQVDTNVVSVGDYAGLRRAIRDFVRGGVEHGVIRVQQYAGGVAGGGPGGGGLLRNAPAARGDGGRRTGEQNADCQANADL